ncbi:MULTISPECIES: hypothetical protein [unclassified Bradyrhizobium]|uniref:hypothetical protein n=1 Tax=unclassified Bradyrhizobium TaxID=2631580 RepID=UPI00102ECA25|nr:MULTISPECIES: hypothetical protein [unclassified Bradyrhizobium]MDI4237149.1 hypothetical protein [Bradyrhizobium sp. Arg237L]
MRQLRAAEQRPIIIPKFLGFGREMARPPTGQAFSEHCLGQERRNEFCETTMNKTGRKRSTQQEKSTA